MHNFNTIILIIFVCSLFALLSPLSGQWNKHITDSNLDGSCFIYIEDIDDDGDRDVAATGYLANLVVWYENTGGTPISWTRHTIDQYSHSPHGIHVADLDKDQDMDVVVAEYSLGMVVWYENLGGSPLNWRKDTIDANLPIATRITVEDIDDDDDLDVAASPFDGDLCVWYENLDGTAQNWSEYIIDPNGGQHLRFADMDGDSAIDLITTGKLALEVVWYKNNLPDPNWTKNIIDDQPPGVRQTRVGDIDGDQDYDVAITTNNANKVIWYKNLDGSAQNWDRCTIDSFLGRSAGLDLCDINGDSALDVVASGNAVNHVVWYRNNLPDTNWTKHIIDSNLPGAANLKTEDLEYDGDPDVFVVGQNADQVVWYENLLPVGINQFSKRKAKSFSLSQNYPNPFNPTTVISWQLAVGSTVNLTVYNIAGQRVATLLSASLPAGFHEYEWDASHMPSGVYL
jgi:hypothetical protein